MYPFFYQFQVQSNQSGGGGPVGISSPLDISDCKFWSNGANVVQTSAIISQMTDLSGNNNHATQATVANQPVLIASSLNSLPAVKFNGNQLLVSNFQPTSNHTLFFVYRNRINGGSFYSALNQNRPLQRETQVWNNENNSNINLSLNLNSKNCVCFSMSYSTPFNEVFVNNNTSLQSVGSNTAGGSQPYNEFVFGARNGNQEYINAEICEIIVYTKILSASERDQVYQWIKSKYNL